MKKTWEDYLIEATVSCEFAHEKCDNDDAKQRLWNAYIILMHLCNSYNIR